MSESTTSNQLFIRKLSDLILENLSNENFGVQELANLAGISSSSLNRRIKSICKKSTNQFIREVRLRKALEMLRTGEYNANEVSYRTGFSSPAYFNTCFHKFYGYPPGEVHKIHNENNETITAARSDSRSRTLRSVWKSHNLTIPGFLIIALLTATIGFAAYKKTHKSSWTDQLVSPDGRISIAVLPFRNMTHDTVWNIWQEGIQQTIISYLTRSKELKVIEKENIESTLLTKGVTQYTSISPGIAGVVSKSLNTNVFISGNIIESGPGIRLDAILISTKREEVLQSFEINGPSNESRILDLTDTLRKKITDFLLISRLIKENPWLQSSRILNTLSPEALKCNIYADRAFNKADWNTARKWLFMALEADSNYIEAMSGIYFTYANQGMTEQSLFWIQKLYNIRQKMSLKDKLWYSWTYDENFEPPDSCISYLKQLQELDDQNNYYYLIGADYLKSGKPEKAIEAFKDHLEYCRRKGKQYLKDNWVFPALAEVYQTTGQYKKEKRLLRQAERINDDKSSEFFSWVIRDEVALAVAEKDTVKANRLIKRLISDLKERTYSDADIAKVLAWQYWRGNDQDRAEELFRKALRLEPENPESMNTLANRLIDRNRNFGEVIDLIDKALKLTKNKYDYFDYLDTKAWGLYKFGKLQESLELFQNLWDTTPYKRYVFKSHLDEVKKAIANHPV